MDRVREIASPGSRCARRAGLRVRLPLARLTVVIDRRRGARAVRATSCATSSTSRPSSSSSRSTTTRSSDYGITQRLTVNARAAGPRLGKQVQQVIQAAKAGDWTRGRRRRHRRAASRSSDGRVRPRRSRPADPASAHRLPAAAAASCCSTPRRPPSSRRRASRATSSAPCRTRARPPGFDVSDRIRLAVAGRSPSDIEALTRVRGRRSRPRRSRSTHLRAVDDPATVPHSRSAAHRATLAAGQYANAGHWSLTSEVGSSDV